MKIKIVFPLVLIAVLSGCAAVTGLPKVIGDYPQKECTNFTIDPATQRPYFTKLTLNKAVSLAQKEKCPLNKTISVECANPAGGYTFYFQVSDEMKDMRNCTVTSQGEVIKASALDKGYRPPEGPLPEELKLK